MARPGRKTEISGGLSMPSSVVDGLTFGEEKGNAPKEETNPAHTTAPDQPTPAPVATTKEKEPAAPVTETPETPARKSDLTGSYQETLQSAPERRNIRLNFTVTPTMAEKLDNAVRNRQIKSKNDLINFLVEKYFKELEEKDKK